MLDNKKQYRYIINDVIEKIVNTFGLPKLTSLVTVKKAPRTNCLLGSWTEAVGCEIVVIISYYDCHNKLEMTLSGFAKATENRSLSKASMVDPVVSNDVKMLSNV